MRLPWRRDESPDPEFVVPDFIPEDETGPVGAPPPSRTGHFFGDSEEMAHCAEQTLAEAVHRLRASEGTFLLITPVTGEHGGGFDLKILITGDLQTRVTAYMGLGQIVQSALMQLAHGLAHELSSAMLDVSDGSEEGE